MIKKSEIVGDWYQEKKPPKTEELPLFHRHQRLLKNVFAPVDLSESTEIFVGQNYQLRNKYLLPKRLFLAMIVNEIQMMKDTDLQYGSMAVASTNGLPTRCNVFKFMSPNEGKNKAQSKICYGEDFFIKLTGKDLYLKFETPGAHSLGQYKELHLTDKPDSYCKFQFYHWNDKYKYVDLRTTDLNSRVYIIHTRSGLHLCAEETQIPTLLGTVYEVACKWGKNRTGNYTPGSIWKVLAKVDAQTVDTMSNKYAL